MTITRSNIILRVVYLSKSLVQLSRYSKTCFPSGLSLSLSLSLSRCREERSSGKREKNLPRAREEVSLSRLNGLRWMQAEIRIGCLSLFPSLSLSLLLRCQVPLLSLLLIGPGSLSSGFVRAPGIVLHHGFRAVYSATYNGAIRCGAQGSIRLLRGSFDAEPSRAEPRHAAPSYIFLFRLGLWRTANFNRVHRANCATIDATQFLSLSLSLSFSSLQPRLILSISSIARRSLSAMSVLVLSGYGPIPRPRRVREAGDHSG